MSERGCKPLKKINGRADRTVSSLRDVTPYVEDKIRQHKLV